MLGQASVLGKDAARSVRRRRHCPICSSSGANGRQAKLLAPTTVRSDAAYWFNGKWDIRRVSARRVMKMTISTMKPDMFLIGKKTAGRTLDGEIHDGYPA